MQDHDPIQDGIDAFEIVRGDQHGRLDRTTIG